MNVPPVDQKLSDRTVDDEHVVPYINRELGPLARLIRKALNYLAVNSVEEMTASGTVTAGNDLVLVDASSGPVTVTPPSAELWEKRIVVIKTDASANTVTVAGVVNVVLATRYDAAEITSDGVSYYPVATPTSLGGDVTGTAANNRVSHLQTVLLTVGTPNRGDVLMYDGTQIISTPLQIRAIPTTVPTTGAPVGCWLMNQGGTTAVDISGNGNNLTAEAGTVRSSRVFAGPGGAAFLFDGATKMSPGAPKAVLQTLGAMTFAAILVWSDLASAGNSRTIASEGAAGETSDTNYIFTMAIDSSNQHTYFSEHGAGVNDTAQVNTFIPRGILSLVGFTRTAGGVVTSWQDSINIVPDMGTVTLPTDGSNTTFRIGGDDGTVNYFTGAIQSAALYNYAFSAQDWKDLYNFCLGPICGFR